ncbi:MAG: polyphosphate kinase 2 [Hyphomicrobiaceae bacterium]
MGKNDATPNAKSGQIDRETLDLDDPKLPAWVEDRAMASGGYPYEKRLKRDRFEDQLKELQIELAKLQIHCLKTGLRIVVVFEGRDSAGKGSCISHFRQHLNPRNAHVVALTRPTETERGQWYFQRYVNHLPTAGDIALFDRSWYNRAGVERVMGFATENEVADFLRETPQFEGMLVRDGIKLFKVFLDIGREMQLKRFHERRHDPLKQWKISEMDLAAMSRFETYTKAKEEMFRFTHTAVAPWTVILANDQRRARLEAMRLVLSSMEYQGKVAGAVGRPDGRIVGSGPEFFQQRT